jgi:hypothetical protein
MKKVVVKLTIISIVLFVAACGDPFTRLKDYKIDGYMEAPEAIFTTPVEQNKLGGTLMYVDGRITKIDRERYPNPFYNIETAHGPMLVLVISYTNSWENLEVGDNIRTYFVYIGLENGVNSATGVYVAYIDPKNIPEDIPEDILLAEEMYGKPVTIPEEIPAHVQVVYDNFERVLASNEFIFTLEKGSLQKTSHRGNYRFSMSDGADTEDIGFWSKGDGSTQNAFGLNSYLGSDQSRTKKLATIMLMATNPALDDKSSAALLAKELIDSYREREAGKVIESGDYLVFITSDFDKYIKAIHKDQIFDVDRSLYEKPDYEAMMREEYADKRVYISGTVEKISSKWSSILGISYTIQFADDEGTYYFLEYNFDNIPIVMNVGDQYIAYGTLFYYLNDPQPYITLEKLEAR